MSSSRRHQRLDRALAQQCPSPPHTHTRDLMRRADFFFLIFQESFGRWTSERAQPESVRKMISAALFLLAVGQPARATVEPLRINGLVAATFTPFSKDGSVNTKEAENQAQWLNATGVKWIFLSGTTGESLKLSMEERLAQAELWLKLAPTYGIRVIVHTGAESIPVAKALTRHAVANGADAIGAMPPVFFKPVNTQALAATMASIAAEAPKLPFYYYHIPSMTGVAFPDGMLGLAQEMEKLGVSNFAGVKYTGLYTYPGMMDAVKLLNYKQGKFEVLCGRDELMIEALMLSKSSQ